MGKIIKYEWKKQRTARLIILFALLVGIIVFTFGAITDNGTSIGVSIISMFSGAFLVIFYTGIESLLVFNKDLRTKQSHMLWMIPKSIYEILGSKFIAAILQMLFVFVAFTAAGCICLFIAIAKSGRIKAIVEIIQQLGKALLHVDIITWKFFATGMSMGFLAWAMIIMIGFLSIIISRTLFLNSRFSGLFSVILFFVINYVIEKGFYFVNQLMGSSTFVWSLADFLYYLIVCALLFGASGILADKKLSV